MLLPATTVVLGLINVTIDAAPAPVGVVGVLVAWEPSLVRSAFNSFDGVVVGLTRRVVVGVIGVKILVGRLVVGLTVLVIGR